VWVEWTKSHVKGTINTGVNVTGIDRSGAQPIVKFGSKVGSKWQQNQQICSSIILAFPPTSDNLNAAGLDITSTESDLFSEVGVNNYFSSAVRTIIPHVVSYIAESPSLGVPPPNNGEPIALLNLQNNSGISTTWSWGPYRQFESEDSAYQLLKTTLSKINLDPRNASSTPVPITDSDVKAFRKWDYFPRFDSPDLKNHAYDRLNALQGQKKTYYASGLNGMETVEWAIRAGLDVANSYF
jgi:hypothetical protein